MIAAGALKHLIEIQAPSYTSDSTGAQVATFATRQYGKRRAQIRPIAGRERYVAEQLQQQVTHEIKTRYLAGAVEGDRVLVQGRVFTVLQVRDWDFGHVEMSLFCVERVEA